MNIEQLMPHFGAKITNTSIDELLNTEESVFKSLLYQNHLLVIPEIHFNELQMLKFGKKFGSLYTTPEYRKGMDIPVDTEEGAYANYSNKIYTRLGDAEVPWHCDLPNSGVDSYPMRSLYGCQIPVSEGGKTEFADLVYHYHHMLTEQERIRFSKYVVTLQSWHYPGTDFHKQPFTRVHPISGHTSLVLNSANNDPMRGAWIVKLEDEHGNEVPITVVREHLQKSINPAFRYIHTWKKGDFVMMDNYSLVHRRSHLQLKPTDERILWRMNVRHDYSFDFDNTNKSTVR